MKTQNKKGFNLVELDPSILNIHELANNNPMMPEEQYREFVKKFENGFDKNVSHIIMYKGKVVDGRNRVKACSQLGIKLWARNLPETMATDEVENLIDNTENRRHQTSTQSAVGAYKYYRNRLAVGDPVSQEIAAARKLSNRKHLARAQELARLIGDDLMDKLHNGEKLIIHDQKTGLKSETNSLTTLINHFKLRNEDMIPKTTINNSLTDSEIHLAYIKFNELIIECNMMVILKVKSLISEYEKQFNGSNG